MSNGRRETDLTTERLKDMVRDAERVANEARAEFRAVRDEIKDELRSIRYVIEGDPLRESKGLKQRVDDLKNSFENLQENRTIKFERGKMYWTSLTSIVVQGLFVVGLLILNWERVEDFVKSHLHHDKPVAAAAQKTKHHKKRKPLPPILVPEASTENEKPNQAEPSGETK